MIWKKSLVLISAFALFHAATPSLADENGKWISSSFSLGNSVGIGTFSSSGTSSQWSTYLTVSPSIKLPFPTAWPIINIDAEIGANMWWLNSLGTSAYDVTHRIQFPDALVWISAPRLLELGNSGLALSASIPIVLPISAASRAFSRVLSVGASAGLSFRHSSGVGVAVAPQVRAWLHSDKAKTISCRDGIASEFGARLLNPQNIDTEVDQYMMALSFYGNEGDGSDTCVIAGRQNTWSLKLPVSASFKTESHYVVVGLSYYWNFLRPLEDRPDLSSPNSSNGSFTQVVLGRVAYQYKLPVSFDLAVTAGIINYASVFSKTGNLTFPLFDFETPNKNQTEIFVEMTASL